MVTTTDVSNVQESWAKIYDQWDQVHATGFYNQLFANNEAISDAFAKAGTCSGIALKSQALKFGAMLEEFITNLGDPVALNFKINGLCATHNTRGITDMGLFQFALNDLVEYISTKVSFTKAQKASWEAVNASILQQMNCYFSG